MSLSVPEIADLVAQDFAARSITAKVIYGSFEVTKHNDGNHVVIGLADPDGAFTIEPPGLPNAPGGHPYTAGPNGLVACAIASRAQVCTAWVHQPPNPNPKAPKRLEGAQHATASLVDSTVAALWRIANGSILFGAGKWPGGGRVPGVLYGSLSMFNFTLFIPILDDANVEVFPAGAAMTTTMEFTSAQGPVDVVVNQEP